MENYSTMADGGAYKDDEVVYFCPETYDLNTITGAFFSLIFIFSLAGNVLILCALVIFKNLKNVTNMFILNLACSDLIFTSTLPFWAVFYLHHWVFGDFTCKFMTAAYFVGLHSSIILLTVITVDRYIMVVLRNWPSKLARRQRCAKAACAAAWVISIAASLSDALKVKVETHWNLSSCSDISDDHDIRLGYYLQVSLLFFLPLAIIVFCYSAILKTVLQTSNRKKWRTVVLVFCIVAAFFICWGPYNILLFITSLYKPKGCHAIERLHIAYSICRIIAFSHCCMNPLLYMFSQNLRKHLLKLLQCKTARKARERDRERSKGQSTSVFQNVVFVTQSSAVNLEIHSK